MRRAAFFLLLAFVATIPLNSALSLGAVGSMNKFIGFAAGGAWVAVFVTSGRLRHLLRFHLVLLAFLFWALLSLVIWSDAVEAPVETLPLLAVMVVMLWDSCKTEWDVDAVLQAFVVGAGLAALSLLYNYRLGVAIGFEEYGFFDPDNMVTVRFQAAGTDPNELGVMLAAAIAMAAYLLSKGSFGSKGLRILNLLFVPAGVLAIALTGSRTGALALGVALAFALYSGRRLRFGGRLLGLTGIVLGVLAIQEFVPAVTIERILGTADNALSGDFSGRGLVWLEGLELFAQNPAIGVGAYSFSASVPSGLPAHSLPIQASAELGAVGLVLLVTVLAIAASAARTSYRWGDGFWVALMAIWALGALTLSWTYQKFTYLVLSMIVAAWMAQENPRLERPAVPSARSHLLANRTRRSALTIGRDRPGFRPDVTKPPVETDWP